MVDQLILALTLLSALGCGLVAGAFFAFSSFVMKALARLPPAQGIAAMQSINVVVLNPWFLGVFVGTAAACVLAVICAFLRWHERSAIYLLLGGALYLIGTFAVTAVFNVPRNDALAKLAPDDPRSASVWAEYVAGWTNWNHVRTVASLVATALFSLALRG